MRRHVSRGSRRRACAPIAAFWPSRNGTRPQRKLGELECLTTYVDKLGDFEKTSRFFTPTTS